VSSSENEYKENRLRNQIEWYGTMARWNKSKFKVCQNSMLTASIAILVMNVAFFSIFDSPDVSIIITSITSILGVIIALIATITQSEKYNQHWISYRKVVSNLHKEKYFFENSVGEYDQLNEGQKNRTLVQRIESIVSGKNSEYSTIRFSKGGRHQISH
jgi:Protein of unknown function (DUF4231)